MIRVGLAGAGWVAGYHLDAWRQIADRASVVAIADPNLAAAKRRASGHGIADVYESVEALLHGHEIDAIDVAAPREAHAHICRLAAARGVHILCQKPLAPTLAEAEALIAAIGAGARLMVHENWRFRPHYRRIRGWLDEERIGAVRTVTMSVITSGLLPDRTGALPALVRQPMLMTLERMLVMEVLIHHVDTLRYLLGPLTIAAAQLGRHCQAIAGEDRAALLLATAAGAAVSVLGDFMAHGHPPQATDRLEILGTHGTIRLDRDRLQVIGRDSEDIVVNLAEDYAASYAASIAHFVDRLADGAPFETGAADNLETLRIVEDAYRIGGWPGSADVQPSAGV